MRNERSQRDAAAQPLGEGHDVGNDTRVLETEHPPSAADPGLDLVKDQQDLPVPREDTQIAQERLCCLEDAGFALDWFQHNPRRSDP